MDYYELVGDLTHYITNDFFKVIWFDKLQILDCIISGLKSIHQANIIHKDYHSGNIFMSSGKFFSQIIAITGDLGISKSAIESSDDEEIYGIIPYVAPEIFQRKKYTKASDIYSVGMIMWELMTGRRPFWDQIYDAELIIKICDGFRPPIVTNAPVGYIELMQECWHPDPEKRPTGANLMEKIKIIDYGSTEIIKSPDIGPIANNPGAIYKSRPLSIMIKSAESTRNLRSQRIISGKYSTLFYNDD
jgi:serine/threonine protein kinase